MKNIATFAFATLTCFFASYTNAGLIVELTKDGADGVTANFSGSGTASVSANCSNAGGLAVTDFCVIGADMGDYTIVDNTSFALASPLALTPSGDISIVGLYIDDDGVLDDGGIYLDDDPISPFNYDISGSSFINGLSFSSLNPGTFTAQSSDFDSLTYIIRGAPVSAPATQALIILGLAGLGWSRSRKA